MADGNKIASGVKRAALAARPAVPESMPAGYGLAYQMGGPYYMYGETPRFGAYYRDGGTPPGQIHGNFAGSREGADMFGFWPTMFQRSPYATASQMYTPGLGVMPLVGYPSRYPHVIMGGYSDYGAGIANQAMGMMLPLLMMGLYRQMFPMQPQAPAAAAARPASGGGGGSRSGGGSGMPAPSAGPLQSSGVPEGVPALDYSAVDGMPVQPSRDSTYHVYDAGWTPPSGAPAKAPSGDAWVDRALRVAKAVPPLMPMAYGAEYVRKNPEAGRILLGSVPVAGPGLRMAADAMSQ